MKIVFMALGRGGPAGGSFSFHARGITGSLSRVTWTMALAIPIILAAIFFMIRGFDVRLVLFSAGLALCTVALDPLKVFDAFQSSMVDVSYVTPICTAMAFASVLAAAGCDREMVRLLMKPLRNVKW